METKNNENKQNSEKHQLLTSKMLVIQYLKSLQRKTDMQFKAISCSETISNTILEQRKRYCISQFI